MLDALTTMGIIRPSRYWTSENAADLIQSFLVCFEMVIAALLHVKAFPYSEFINPDNPSQKTPVFRSMLDALSPMHILRDITAAPRDVRMQRKRRKERRRKRLLGEFGDEFDDDAISMVDVELGSPRRGSAAKSPRKGWGGVGSPLKSQADIWEEGDSEDDDSSSSEDLRRGQMLGASESREFTSNDPLHPAIEDGAESPKDRQRSGGKRTVDK